MSQALRPLLGEAMTPEVLMAIEGHARTFLGPGFRMEVNGNQIAFVMDDGLLRRPT